MSRHVFLVLVLVSSIAACNKTPEKADQAARAAAELPLLISPEDLITVHTGDLASGPVITGSVEPERRADHHEARRWQVRLDEDARVAVRERNLSLFRPPLVQHTGRKCREMGVGGRVTARTVYDSAILPDEQFRADQRAVHDGRDSDGLPHRERCFQCA
jgi:hypothetical protein